MTQRPLTKRERQDLQPATELWQLYRPEEAALRFQATDLAAAQRWQRATRKALLARIGFNDLPAVDPSPRLLESVDKGDYRRDKVLIQTSPHSAMPVYILQPKNAPRPLPVVLALHGHGYGVKDIVGLWEDGAERDTADGYHKDFAVALCRRGFAVAAPEISCFGERQTDFSHLDGKLGQPAPYCCTHTAMLAFHLGGSVVGLRIHDGLRLVDYLETRPDLDCRRLGAMGISGGGMHSFFSTALDTRIRACVVSGYYCSFRQSLFAMHHCCCNFVPGMKDFGEIYDLVGLIAPRPMLIEAGTRDPIFPLAGVREAVAKGNAVYRVFDPAGRIVVDRFEGRHQVSGAKAYDFLWENLG